VYSTNPKGKRRRANTAPALTVAEERCIDRLLARGFERGWISREILHQEMESERKAAKAKTELQK
jgi:hypothetical protein